MLGVPLDRLKNAVIVPADGSARFVFRPMSIIATELWDALLLTGTPWLISVAAVPEPWNGLPFLAGLLVIPLAMHRALRISVAADERGLAVKNYWRTFFLPWAEISEVRGAYETVGPLPTPVIAFATSKRKLVRVVATATADKHKRALVRQLKTCPELTNVPFNLSPELLA
jgi:hypothetical protein